MAHGLAGGRFRIMANTGNIPNSSKLAGPAAKMPLGPGSPPQKEQRTTSGADLQDDQHQPAQQDVPLNAAEPYVDQRPLDRGASRKGETK